MSVSCCVAEIRELFAIPEFLHSLGRIVTVGLRYHHGSVPLPITALHDLQFVTRNRHTKNLIELYI